MVPVSKFAKKPLKMFALNPRSVRQRWLRFRLDLSIFKRFSFKLLSYLTQLFKSR